MKNDKEPTGRPKDNQQPVHSNRKLEDLFKEDSAKDTEPTPGEEAEAEQQRKEALTERD